MNPVPYMNASHVPPDATPCMGCRLWIEEDREDDCIKNWHYVLLPDGHSVVCAPLSPYVGMSALVAWVRAGMPEKP